VQQIGEDSKNKTKNIPAAESTCVTLDHDIYTNIRPQHERSVY